ncbi:MAG: hypothetical protein WCP63_08935, partial [Cyanobium sp. ELA712]
MQHPQPRFDSDCRQPRRRDALISSPPATVSGADDTADHTIEPAAAEPPWRQQLRASLGDLPAVRRRRLRSLAPGGLSSGWLDGV